MAHTEIATRRLRLRTLSPQDAEGPYSAWLADPEILQFLEVRHAGLQSQQAIAAFIAGCNASSDALLLGIFADDGVHIGNIKIGPIEALHERATLGFLIGDKSRWGMGFASEAIFAATEFAFANYGVSKVVAGCYASNVSSAKALEKAGFGQEAVLKRHWCRDGRFEDGWVYAKFREHT